jgi:hypothetical protein
MDYKIDKKACRIRCQGTTQEIRTLIETLEDIISKGQLKNEIEEDMNTLETISTLQQLNYNAIERIYYNHNSAIFGPNAHNGAFYFPLLIKHFEEYLQRTQQEKK